MVKRRVQGSTGWSSHPPSGPSSDCSAGGRSTASLWRRAFPPTATSDTCGRCAEMCIRDSVIPAPEGGEGGKTPCARGERRGNAAARPAIAVARLGNCGAPGFALGLCGRDRLERWRFRVPGHRVRLRVAHGATGLLFECSARPRTGLELRVRTFADLRERMRRCGASPWLPARCWWRSLLASRSLPQGRSPPLGPASRSSPRRLCPAIRQPNHSRTACWRRRTSRPQRV